MFVSRHPAVLVLSPHADDAAFSIAAALQRLASAGHPICIVNCFTDTRFAPYRAKPEQDVPRLRREEDEEFGRSLGELCSIVDLRLKDALGRAGIRGMFLPNATGTGVETAVAELHDRLPEHPRTGAVLAPLAIGFHTDHVIACHAAIRKYGSHALAFYEDLPYAATVSEEAIAARAGAASLALNAALSPLLFQCSEGLAFKESACLHYASQIAPSGIVRILEHWKQVGGERLWVTPAFAACTVAARLRPRNFA